MPTPKGELETVYGSPWGGVDYSRPYNVLDPQFLAPGSVNTSQINGFLTSSPWVGASPYSDALAANEFVIGIFYPLPTALNPAAGTLYSTTLIVTNLNVYVTGISSFSGGNVAPSPLVVLHTWDQGVETDVDYLVPGNCVSFCEVNGTVYFTGLMLSGIFSTTQTGDTTSFAVATTYVSAAYLIELAGYLFAAECRFPTGGGTGTGVLPTVAWSGPGEYAGSGGSDPWNPVNMLGGGYNLLADVPDQITGLAGIGRSALIFRNDGVSQADPNPGTANSGLQPFTFYHLWASSEGVGAFQGTVSQFGQQVTFLSSDNVYSISINAGLQALGPRIIPKIIRDHTAASNLAGVGIPTSGFHMGTGSPSVWYFSSIINIDGQLHYLLTFSAYTLPNGSAAQTPTATSLVYDFNFSENAWHLWDFQKYLQQGGAGQAFLFPSCPIVAVSESYSQVGGTAAQYNVSGLHVLMGMFTSYAPVANPNPQGQIFQLVPWSYDFASDPITPYVASIYPVASIPNTTITMRAEVISLGHKISIRRLRVQADNAPLPSFAAGSQQQALAVFTGMIEGTLSAVLAWTDANSKIQPYMQGNYPSQGAAIQTYYGSVTLSDEMIQPSLATVIADPSNPWNSMPAFRIATMSLIMLDAGATTQ